MPAARVLGLDEDQVRAAVAVHIGHHPRAVVGVGYAEPRGPVAARLLETSVCRRDMDLNMPAARVLRLDEDAIIVDHRSSSLPFQISYELERSTFIHTDGLPPAPTDGENPERHHSALYLRVRQAILLLSAIRHSKLAAPRDGHPLPPTWELQDLACASGGTLQALNENLTHGSHR